MQVILSFFNGHFIVPGLGLAVGCKSITDFQVVGISALPLLGFVHSFLEELWCVLGTSFVNSFMVSMATSATD